MLSGYTDRRRFFHRRLKTIGKSSATSFDHQRTPLMTIALICFRLNWSCLTCLFDEVSVQRSLLNLDRSSHRLAIFLCRTTNGHRRSNFQLFSSISTVESNASRFWHQKCHRQLSDDLDSAIDDAKQRFSSWKYTFNDGMYRRKRLKSWFRTTIAVNYNIYSVRSIITSVT